MEGRVRKHKRHWVGVCQRSPQLFSGSWFPGACGGQVRACHGLFACAAPHRLTAWPHDCTGHATACWHRPHHKHHRPPRRPATPRLQPPPHALAEPCPLGPWHNQDPPSDCAAQAPRSPRKPPATGTCKARAHHRWTRKHVPRRPCGSSPVAQRIKDTPPFPLALAGQRTWPASPAALLELAVQIERAREGEVFWHCGKACVLPSRGRRGEQLPPPSPRRGGCQLRYATLLYAVLLYSFLLLSTLLCSTLLYSTLTLVSRRIEGGQMLAVHPSHARKQAQSPLGVELSCPLRAPTSMPVEKGSGVQMGQI